MNLTQAELKKHLRYEPETGIFVWLETERRNDLVGQEAGYTDNRGYIWIRMPDGLYLAHRLAFLYMTGEMPELVDHKKGMSNRWDNLRAATKSSNAINSKLRSDNKTGHRGVTLLPRGKKRWYARIKSSTAYISKTFVFKEDAIAWYDEQAAKLHGEFRYSGPPQSDLTSSRESLQISPLLGFDITLLGPAPLPASKPLESLGNSNPDSAWSLNLIF